MNNDSIKRIAYDVKYIYNNKIDGIYYKHDEENIYKGRAMIIGPPETPYEYGYYLFEFNFTSNYPYEPPKITYLTNNGYTRFHPNLYIDGKVCLSILNTWPGDPWSSCQNIKSILLTLLTILDKEPLLHEPGININSIYLKSYNEIITFMNLNFAIINLYKKTLNNNNNNTQLDEILYYFKDEIINEFKKNYNDIQTNIKNNIKRHINIEKCFYNVEINYNLKIDYNKLLSEFNKLII